jgi:poly(hydroxyalkanoate) granule-associated protein
VRGKEWIMAVRKKGRLGGAAAASTKKGGEKPHYPASQIWSAGLGAMSRAQAGGSKFFEELVREGTRLQGGALTSAQKMVMQAFQGAQKSVNRRVDDVRDQATETWDNLEKIFQTRVQRALHQLGMPTAEEIGALTRKVDQLARSVDKLAGKKPAAGRRAKTAAKGRTARSKAAKRKSGRSRPTRRSAAAPASTPPAGT